MVAKSYEKLKEAAEAIERSLTGLEAVAGDVRFYVFQSSPWSLHAIVGTDAVKDLGMTEGQDFIWDHLRKHLDYSLLQNLFAVHVYDLEEYKRNFGNNDSARLAAFVAEIREEVNG